MSNSSTKVQPNWQVSDLIKIGICGLVGAAFFGTLTSYSVIDSFNAKNWKPIQGKVLSNFYDKSRRGSRQRITYQYIVDEKQYENDRYRFDDGSYESYFTAEKAELEVGQEITIWYDPTRPERSSIKLEFGKWAFTIFSFSVAMGIGGSYALFRGILKWRLQERPTSVQSESNPRSQLELDQPSASRIPMFSSRKALMGALVQNLFLTVRLPIQAFAPLVAILYLKSIFGIELALVCGAALVTVSTFFPPKFHGLEMLGQPLSKAMMTFLTGGVLVLANATALGLGFTVFAKKFGVVRPWLAMPLLASLFLYPLLVFAFNTPLSRAFYWPSRNELEDSWSVGRDGKARDE